MAGGNIRKTPRQARSRVLHEAILDAAARILTRDGRARTNTNAIAREAGVSVGSLYQYFANLEGIIHALVHRHSQRIHDLVAHCLEPPPATLEEAIRRIVAAVFAAHRLEPALHDALDHDFGDGHHGLAHGHGSDDSHVHDHPSTKSAVRALFADLPATIRAEIRCSTPALAAIVASEIAHSLAHAAIVHPVAAASEAALIEAQAVAAILAYLGTAPTGSPDQPST